MSFLSRSLPHLCPTSPLHLYLQTESIELKVDVHVTGLGIISLFLILQFTRITFFLFAIVFIIHSFWIPQIWRNASKGHNLDMDNLYIFGMSISRLAIPLCKYRFYALAFAPYPPPLSSSLKNMCQRLVDLCKQ